MPRSVRDLETLMPELLRAARRLTGDADQAQDLSQDVLLKLWMRQQRGAPVADLRAYAFAALRNQFRQRLREARPLSPLDEVTLATGPAALPALAVRDLERAIDALPAAQARLLRLVLAGETSPRVLAHLTGLPPGTVMSRLARARARLRAKLGLAPKAPVSELI